MRKIFPFEISMATKDRPKLFQFVTISLFSFCVTVILVASFQRMTSGSQDQQPQQVAKGASSYHFAGMVSATSPESVKR